MRSALEGEAKLILLRLGTGHLFPAQVVSLPAQRANEIANSIMAQDALAPGCTRHKDHAGQQPWHSSQESAGPNSASHHRTVPKAAQQQAANPNQLCRACELAASDQGFGDGHRCRINVEQAEGLKNCLLQGGSLV